MVKMSIGSSGRIVIEIDPSFKRELYSALAKDAKNLKEWFLETASVYVESNRSPQVNSLNADFVRFDQITHLNCGSKKIASGDENE